MRTISVLLVSLSLILSSGCHKKSDNGTTNGNPICHGNYCPATTPAVTQTVGPVLTPAPLPTPAQPTPVAPAIPTTPGPVPALPSDNSQIPATVIVPPPTDKTIKK